MAGAEHIEVIPRTLTEDPRYVIRGDVDSGIANMRIQIRLHTPGFAIDLDGQGVAKRIAEMIRKTLSQNYERGLDAHGVPLPPISPQTTKRRRRRAGQWLVQTGAKQERLMLRARGQTGRRSYLVRDFATPFHESGLMSENVVTEYKSPEYGNPVFLVAFPTGGKARGLVNDDGRGARLFAVQHYGFQRMADLPRSVEAKVDKALTDHLGTVLQAGGSVLELGRMVYTAAERAAQLAEEGTEAR